MQSVRMAIKQSLQDPPERRVSLTSSGESLKRESGVLDESLSDDHVDNPKILFVAGGTHSNVGLKELGHGATSVVSSCSSESCEQSLSSSSNYSAQTVSEAPSRSPRPPSLVEHYRQHDDKRTTNDDSKIGGHIEDSLLLSSFSRPRQSKVKAASFPSRKKTGCNTWDDSSWDLSFCGKRKKEQEAIHAIASTKPYALNPRGKRIKSEVYVTKSKDLHMEDTIWEDTNWHLQSLSFLRKKQKRTTDIIDDTSYFERMFRTKDQVLQHYCVPKNDGSIECELWKRMHQQDNAGDQFCLSWIPMTTNRKVTLATSRPHTSNLPSSADSPYTLYRWLRMRLAAGLVGSSFHLLHRMLKKHYEEAKQIISELEQNDTQEDLQALLLDLRDRLSGLWCVYCHFSLEVGCLALTKSGDESNEETCVKLEDVTNHAISILLKARDCPLVGSHSAIAVSLVRLIVSSAVMEQKKSVSTRVKLSRVVMLNKIRSAIGACWDNIHVLKRPPHTTRQFTTKGVPKKALKVLSHFEVPCQKLQLEKDFGKTTVEEGIESTLFLPTDIRSSMSSTFILSERITGRNKDAISCMCVELNRLSRLRELIEVNSHKTMRLAPSCESELSFAAEELPLFAPVEPLSDPLNLYEEVGALEKGVIWQW